MINLLTKYPLILTEAAIVEPLRRSKPNFLHPQLLNAPLIYHSMGHLALSQLYQDYIGIAVQANLPILLSTPTWRANHERVNNAQITTSINQDAAKFLLGIKQKEQQQLPTNSQNLIKIGGLIGPKNDCYRPEFGLSIPAAEAFHQWQINELVEGGVDFLIAQTLPNLNEAMGIARAMAKTGKDYIISFVINRRGLLLDGNSLSHAIETIDQGVASKPLAYMINCAYPTFLNAAQQPKDLFQRLIGFQANASSLDHTELDGCDNLHTNDIREWASAMLELHQKYGIKILGGCCGTGREHLEKIIEKQWKIDN